MPWLIDGSNVLGAMRADRHSDDAKRGLVKLLAGFARTKRTRVTCIFDGPEPPSFARHLGSVSVVFSAPRTADEIIVARAEGGRGWSVVTSDQALAARIRGRHVSVVGSHAFLREMEAAAAGESESGDDWDAWFADPQNRSKF
jgi:predicted RNA-binding protein with PIN domain